jgi:hypothetical protein
LGNGLPSGREDLSRRVRDPLFLLIFQHIRAGITLETSSYDVGGSMKHDSLRQARFSGACRQLVSIALTALAILTMPGKTAPALGTQPLRHLDPAVTLQHAILEYPRLRDEAAMVLVGAALIGLAAAVRRAA